MNTALSIETIAADPLVVDIVAYAVEHGCLAILETPRGRSESIQIVGANVASGGAASTESGHPKPRPRGKGKAKVTTSGPVNADVEMVNSVANGAQVVSQKQEKHPKYPVLYHLPGLVSTSRHPACWWIL